MDLGEALVLVLCFPVAGLLLFALTVIEERLPGEPPCAHPPHEAGREDDRRPADRQGLIPRPPDRVRRKQSSLRRAPAADRQYRQASGRAA